MAEREPYYVMDKVFVIQTKVTVFTMSFCGVWKIIWKKVPTRKGMARRKLQLCFEQFKSIWERCSAVKWGTSVGSVCHIWFYVHVNIVYEFCFNYLIYPQQRAEDKCIRKISCSLKPLKNYVRQIIVSSWCSECIQTKTTDKSYIHYVSPSRQ